MLFQFPTDSRLNTSRRNSTSHPCSYQKTKLTETKIITNFRLKQAIKKKTLTTGKAWIKSIKLKKILKILPNLLEAPVDMEHLNWSTSYVDLYMSEIQPIYKRPGRSKLSNHQPNEQWRHLKTLQRLKLIILFSPHQKKKNKKKHLVRIEKNCLFFVLV